MASLLYAQNEANRWYFGEHAGLDFNAGTPEAVLDGALNTFEGCATISTAVGNLLFYTDGITVWNKNHEIMLNGNGLNGNTSSTSSAIIIPKPNSSNIYYIFTVDAIAGPKGLQYSEVDITLDGGLGAITVNKNIILETPITEKVAATYNDLTNEYWIVSHKWNSNEFIAYNISENGLNNTSVTSSVGTFVEGDSSSNVIGQIKISPDGTKLAVANYNENAQLFDFDIATGIVSNPLTILEFTSSKPIYGIEFSSNSKVLYVTVSFNGIYQYNLGVDSLSDIKQSEFFISNPSIGGLQIASNGKIYVARPHTTYVDYIDKPNALGANSNYQFNGVFLGGKICRGNLPPFISSFFKGSFQFSNVCLGDNTSFTESVLIPYDSVLWDFGDGQTSTLANPSHTYSNPGDYNVSLTVTISGNVSTGTRAITIYDQPEAFPPEDILICNNNNDNGFYAFDLTIQDGAVLNEQSPSVFEVLYYASVEDYNSGDSIENPENYVNEITNSEESIIAVVRNRDNTNCYAITSFSLIVKEEPVLNMSSQWIICEGNSVNIIADSGYDSYLWSTGEPTQDITVFESGTYTVTASNIYNDLVCETTKQISVVASSVATILEIETVDWTQNDNAITVNVEGSGDYEYSLDGIIYQDNNQFTNLSIDDYTVYIRDKNGCNLVAQDVFLLYYPSYFTPNGDGVHDTWNIYNSNKEPQNIIYIFDRYGKLITQLKPTSNGWDGTLKGNPLPASDYWFVVNRQNGKRYTGHFALKR
jgi:gliding motility-associated-like protein